MQVAHLSTLPPVVRSLVLVMVVAIGCTKTPEAVNLDVPPDNVLLQPWTGPYGGVPAFDRMNLDDLEPAFAFAMEQHLANLDAIAANPEPPTFDNVVVPFERSDRLMGRLYPFYGLWRSNLSSPEVREVAGRLQPRLAEHRSRISENQTLFAKVRAVYESEALKQRSPAEQRLVRILHDGFVRQGAGLEGEAKARFAAIQKRLSVLYTTFDDNVLHDEEAYVLYLDEGQRGGLPESFLAGAAAAADERDHEGKWAVLNTRSSMDPFLTFSTERDLRERVWRTYYDRGDNGDEWDNNAVIQEILVLRHERSRLLGFDDYASWRLDNRMAKTPERAFALMNEVWPAAKARVVTEVADMQAIADAEGAGITIAPWDYRFYAEKVRKDKFDFDSEAVEPYLQLDKLRDAMFSVAGDLFGYTFAPVPEGSVPTFHADVTVF
ncbi:MAG: M3 family metallopeptidase, partial [Myxococcota bacterium]